MAKIKFGMMMTDARGKLGGQVFSKNKGGAYIRTKVTPTNPQTIAQSVVRALFGVISQGWSALTIAQRTAWRESVDSWKTTDVFGDLLSPTGKELYQRLNNQAMVVGYSAITSPPAKVVLPDDIVTAVTIAIGAGTIALTGASTSASITVDLSGTASLTAGTKFVKNRLRNVYAVAGDSFVDATAYTDYVAKFGIPTAGANIVIGVKYVASNGQATPRQTVIATVTA
tara:strand:- start:2301 stop:2981 length:681 start_codon:yes stop_codon:yes gene_type:complete